MTYKINSLLSSEPLLRDVPPFQEEQVTLDAGLKGNYRVAAKEQPEPLRIRVYMQKGIGGCHMSISQRIERPTKDHCEKGFLMDGREMSLVYSGEKDYEKAFDSKFVFLAFEADKPVSLTFVVCFGNSNTSFQSQNRSIREEAGGKGDEQWGGQSAIREQNF